MKRFGIMILVFVLALGLVACGNGKDKTKEVVEEDPIVTPVELKDEEETPKEEPEEEIAGVIALKEPLVVMDAAMYRGTVTSLQGGNEKSMILEQYEGTNFGRKEITVHITENSRGNFDLELLAEGQYLEIYYGRNLSATGTPEEVEAIAINYLGVGEERNFNALVVEVRVSEENPKEGSILVTDLQGENETIFNYAADGSTQIYTNIENIVPGVKLNIFHKPMMTMSLPPQMFGEEIRLYAEAEETEETPEENQGETTEEASEEAADAINVELENIV